MTVSRTANAIEKHCSALTESFADIIAVAKVLEKDKCKISQESYQIECRATNIVRQTEGLLTIVSDLKQSFFLNDTQTLLQLTAGRRKALRDQSINVKKEMVHLRDDVDQAIYDLEDIYYSSPYRD